VRKFEGLEEHSGPDDDFSPEEWNAAQTFLRKEKAGE
jgi:hypothetical protein